MRLIGMRLISIHLVSVHLMGMHFMGVDLIDMYLYLIPYTSNISCSLGGL
jgi:hypothetical protein